MIVEDDYFQAFDFHAELLRCGADVLGPTASLDGAFLQLSNEPTIDVALVDLKLSGEMAFPFIDELIRREIPLALVTGYDARIVPYRFQHIRLCEKPVSAGELVRVAGELVT